MSNNNWQILQQGLWHNNIVFTQSLALCPLMAVTSSAVNGLGLGLATWAVLILSNSLIAALRHWIPNAIRIPIFIVIIATLVSLIDRLLNAYVHELHKVLGLFIPLIVTNCAILGRADAFAQKNRLPQALLDGFAMGAGFCWALVVIGAIREILGSGTLFQNASQLLGPHFAFLEITLIESYRGFLLFILPPGGFLVMGALLGIKARWAHYQASKQQLLQEQTV